MNEREARAGIEHLALRLKKYPDGTYALHKGFGNRECISGSFLTAVQANEWMWKRFDDPVWKAQYDRWLEDNAVASMMKQGMSKAEALAWYNQDCEPLDA
jgi:hypothetical protein